MADALTTYSEVFNTDKKLDAATCVKIHDEMVKGRLLEERLIKMFKKGQGHFWIGGPGEEAFNVSLGLQVHKGQGLDYDYLHLHYRSSCILLAMGLEPLSAFQQMQSSAHDPHSGGRNFASHYSKFAWNLTPITSPIETQYLTAIGTGIAQRDHGGQGITIVNGGDAGSAEGDFASCLIWSSRPEQELPMLIIVTNNQWGISTNAGSQHGERYISDRGTPFGIKAMVVDGNDVHQSYFALEEAMHYVRTERKPLIMEVRVSRLYGHSSASGANFHPEEIDCLKVFEEELISRDILTQEAIKTSHKHYDELFSHYAEQVNQEPLPSPDTIYDYTYWQQTGRTW